MFLIDAATVEVRLFSVDNLDKRSHKRREDFLHVTREVCGAYPIWQERDGKGMVGAKTNPTSALYALFTAHSRRMPRGGDR